jgi:hypothetical protein
MLAGMWAAATLGLSGCGDAFAEKVCGDGEYPVVRGDGAGGSCVKDGQEPTGADVRFPANRVPDFADDFYSPTLGDYLAAGDERQQAIALKQLERLMEAHPNKTREELKDGPLFPFGNPPEGERP